MADLFTRYMGLELANPIVAGASPLGRDLDTVRQLEDAGAGAVVLHSLFEEDLEPPPAVAREALRLEPPATRPAGAPAHPHAEEYLEHIYRLKEAVRIPIVASLNAATLGGWTHFADLVAQAGADALELNLYMLATDPEDTAAQVEARHLEILHAVRRAVDIPLAVKIGPYFTAMAHFARELDRAGADALVLFNRFYQPDVDLEGLRVVPHVLLSTPQAMRLPLRWVAVLHGCLGAHLAASGGAACGEDALKLVLAGADVVQMTSALLRHGPRRLRVVLREMQDWLDEHGIESISEIRGRLSYRSAPHAAWVERAHFIAALQVPWRPASHPHAGESP